MNDGRKIYHFSSFKKGDVAETLWEKIKRKHNYISGTISDNINNFTLDDCSVDVALWCPAVRYDYWIKQYKDLADHNKCTFKIFYCGQIKPPDNLINQFPSNLIYIHCDMPGITPHAEIARRFAVNSNTKYVMDWVDDLYAYPGLLDNLIADMQACDQETVLGPLFRPVMEGQEGNRKNLLRFLNQGFNSRDQCLGFVTHLTKTATAKKIGGFDKRFMGTFCIYDYYLRIYEHEDIAWKVSDSAKIAEDKLQQFNAKHISDQYKINRRASKTYEKHDYGVLNQIWSLNLRGFTGASRENENCFFEDEELKFTVYYSSEVRK
jgi:hypothetical protein